MAGGFVALREGRRRSALNAAMHELRRPLQALYLSLPARVGAARPVESSLELAVAAVERLDREINGDRLEATAASFPLRPLVEEAVERWRPAADGQGRRLNLSWSGDDAPLWGDRIELVQAVDNLITNALRHGSGAISVDVAAEDRNVRLAVRDEGPAVVSAGPQARGAGRGGRNRHGHGLAIVRRAAARHSGSFRLASAPSGTEARLVLALGEERR
ncbi:MAG: sensor histidine kinase [Solirubrobacterales bacterium]